MRFLAVLSVLALGCSSTGTVGLLTRGSADPSSLLRDQQAYEEIGPVEARSCRYFLINLIPWGDSTLPTAMDKALAGTGGDAILNASITTSLYGVFPIYNVFQVSCTTVSGSAVRFTETPSVASSPPETSTATTEQTELGSEE
jgi:hypothetical protein